MFGKIHCPFSLTYPFLQRHSWTVTINFGIVSVHVGSLYWVTTYSSLEFLQMTAVNQFNKFRFILLLYKYSFNWKIFTAFRLKNTFSIISNVSESTTAFFDWSNGSKDSIVTAWFAEEGKNVFFVISTNWCYKLWKYIKKL